MTKRVLPVVALLALGSVVGLLLLEGLLRLAGVSYPNFYDYDYARGGALRAGAAGWWTQEGRAYIEISRDGRRDHDYPEQKPAGTLRIAVLGDSYAEALQVPVEETFWSVLGGRLGACGAFSGRKVEVLNFGVSGYGTAQEWITLQKHAWRYSPDIVVLAFAAGNDVRNNSRQLDGDPVRPFYLYRDGKLVLDESFREHSRFRRGTSGIRPVLGRWRNRLRLLQVLFRIKDVVRVRREVRSAAETAAERPAFEPGLDAAVFAPPQDEAWREAWRVTEGIIAAMNREVAARGAEFWVMLVTAGIQVRPEGAQPLDYPNRRLLDLGRREGFPVVDLAPPLRDYAEKHKTFLHGFREQELGRGHWNALGHRLAGEEVARRLCARKNK
ncbi:MAG: SGNH/GDSL hydrolase family protein [Elusimicrobiota bacterium]